MLDFFTPVTESQSYNNFSMKEKTPVAKINLRGNLENKDFASADLIRERLQKIGIEFKDLPEGTTWEVTDNN